MFYAYSSAFLILHRRLRTVVKSASFDFGMSTLQEIKAAIARLEPREKELLAAELFAMTPEPEETEIEAALERGLADVKAGRVRPIEEVWDMIPKWVSKS